ncbi:MAG TPA: hypothetical protein VLI39_14205 [Sedimentisphaerales bacterium]|nr:hypothetical protein [Sedimentisphaerales bacterium]
MSNIGRPVVWTAERIQELGERLLAWSQNPDNLFLKEFTAGENIPASHLARFAGANPAFAEVMELVSDRLETRLLRGGLNSTHNHNIVKLICVAKYGYTEKTDVAFTAVAAKPVLSTVEACQRAIAEAQGQQRMLEGLIADARLVESIVVA